MASDLPDPGVDRSELHEYKEREMASRLRGLFGPILCLIGIHNWGPPKAQNSLTLRGERQDDGTWEHWKEDPSKTVSQSCRSCPRNREPEDLDWDTLARLQTGKDPAIDTERGPDE